MRLQLAQLDRQCIQAALRIGAQKTLDRSRELAAQALEAAADDLDYDAGRFSVKGTDVGIDLFTLAGRQPEQRIHIDSTSAVAGPSWPNGCHVSEVEVDPATGEVKVVGYASMNDVGRVVNPMIVRGQLDGGAVQGIGQALLEHMVYDRESGQPVSGSLMDYAAPRADILECDFVTDIAASRKLQPDQVRTMFDRGPMAVSDAADAKLIDHIGYADEAVDAARKQAGPGAKTVSLAGALSTVALPSMYDRMGWAPVLLILLGGVFYTLGAIGLYRKWPRLRPHVFGYHEVWHACTVVAAFAHLGAVWLIAA